MSDILEEINTIIKEAIQDNEGQDKVTELNFSEKQLQINKLTPAIKTAIEQCPNVDFLGLSDCHLTSLQNLPNLPRLDTIDLKDNMLNDEEIKRLKDAKNLKSLYVEGNDLERVETLEELGKYLTQLNTLEVGSNPVADISGYEARIWKAFPSLEVLNEHDRHGNKVQENVGDVDEDDLGSEEEEEDYDGGEESEDSEFSEGDYDSENDKPKKKRKTK